MIGLLKLTLYFRLDLNTLSLERVEILMRVVPNEDEVSYHFYRAKNIINIVVCIS